MRSVLFGALMFGSGLFIAQASPQILASKVLVNGATAPDRHETAAQLEVWGNKTIPDAGVAAIVHGVGGSPIDEGYFLTSQKNLNNKFLKTFSLSTRWADPGREIAVTRLNTAFRDPLNGIFHDDLAYQQWGGNGAAFFAADSSMASAPGQGIVWINGRLSIGPQGKAISVADEIAALQARIAKLEAAAKQ